MQSGGVLQVFCGALEAHQAPDQRIVARVRGVRIGLVETIIQAVLRIWDRMGDLESEPFQPRSPNGHQKGGNRVGAAGQILESGGDQIAAWQGLLWHPSVHVLLLNRNPGPLP